MTKNYQKLQNVSDEQIKKAFDLRKRGLQVERIAQATGLTKHSLHVWFSKPPQTLINRIQESELLLALISEHDNLETSTVRGDPEISNQERASIPVVDRRGTSGFASRHQIDLAAQQAHQLNSISPESTYVGKNTVERKLELESQQIYSSPTTTTTRSDGSILPLEIASKNILDLNSKLIQYKTVIEGHLVAINSLLYNLDTLTYIESLEDAEVEYRGRIEQLEQEVLRLRTVERQL